MLVENLGGTGYKKALSIIDKAIIFDRVA